MSNPYGYNERWMHSQNAAAWKNLKLGTSPLTMGTVGCVVTGTAYLLSRFRGHDVTPGDWLRWINAVGGFTTTGLFEWWPLAENTKDVHPQGGLFYQGTKKQGARYTGRWVRFGHISHFVIELRNPTNGLNDIIFDPWDGKVKAAWVYPTLGRVYFGTNVPPKT